MSTVDNGPASIPPNGVIPMFVPGGAVTTGIEVHVGGIAATQPGTSQNYAVNYISAGALNGTGTNPLPPSTAYFVDPGQAGTNVQGNPVVPTAKTVVPGGITGATIIFANPA